MSAIRWFAVPLLLMFAPALACAAEPKRAVGTETLPATGFAVVSVHVAQLWDANALAGLRKTLDDGMNPLVKDMKGETGLGLAEIERFTVSMPLLPVDGKGGSFPILYVTARKALDVPTIMKGIKAVSVAEFRKKKPDFPEAIAGTNVYVVEGRRIVVVLDDRTIAIVQSLRRPEDLAGFLADLKAGKPAQEGPLAEALALAGQHTLVIGVDFAPVRKALEGVGEVPAEFKPLAALVQAERGLLTFDFGDKVSAAATLTFADADAAKKAEPNVKTILGMGRASLAEGKKERGRDAETIAVVDPILAFADAALEKADTKLDGKALHAAVGGEIDAALKKALAAFPAVVTASADKMKTINNLKQIGLAMHSYNDTNLALPQDITDKDGKAILSWRVHLLPYLEQTPLHQKLDLTKPWDDAANKPFVERIPEVFKVHGREPKEKGFTYFQMFTSPEAVESGNPFLVPGRKLTIPGGIPDGTSNTLMIAEGETAVNWLKPGDLPYDPKKLPKLGDPKTGKFNALFCDGSVRRFDIKKLGEANLKGLITIDGGEVVKIDE